MSGRTKSAQVARPNNNVHHSTSIRTKKGNRKSISRKTHDPVTITSLPPEIIRHILHECRDVQSVINLAATCKQYHDIWSASQKLPIILRAITHQFSPIEDAIQLVTYNDSEPAHIHRNPPISLSLLKDIFKVGTTANKWLDTYPMLRWGDGDSSSRRLLTPTEQFKFRRALFRYWHYSRAFHNPTFLSEQQHRHLPRPSSLDRRLTFMRSFSEDEIIEIAEIHEILHDVVRTEICPTNAQIQAKFSSYFPGQDLLYFGSYTTHPGRAVYGQPKIRPIDALAKKWQKEAWGAYDDQVASVSDIMKLEPDQLLFLKEELLEKRHRLEWLDAHLPEGWHGVQASCRRTMEVVMAERGVGLGCVADWDGWRGVVGSEESENGDEEEDEEEED
jgi:hypothetical protein